MYFGETPKDLGQAEKERLARLGDELDVLQRAWAAKSKVEGGVIPYVNWIVSDLRRGDLGTAKANYEQQQDKYDDKPEIRKFLEDNGIATKGIDWSAWHGSDSYEEYLDNRKI